MPGCYLCGVSLPKRAGHSQKREDRDQRGGIAQHAAVASVGCVGGARQREDAVY